MSANPLASGKGANVFPSLRLQHYFLTNSGSILLFNSHSHFSRGPFPAFIDNRSEMKDFEIWIKRNFPMFCSLELIFLEAGGPAAPNQMLLDHIS
jgi:hypothetical protein